MPERELPSPPDTLPRALLVALMHEAERAVDAVNGALWVQLNQPAQPPAEAEAWRANLVDAVIAPLFHLWQALEPAQLPQAGAHVILALIREMVEKAAVGSSILRQFTTPPPAPTPASPAPGASA
jgi:hypothetical protein